MMRTRIHLFPLVLMLAAAVLLLAVPALAEPSATARPEIAEISVTVTPPEADRQPDRAPAVPDGAPYEIVTAVWHLSSDTDLTNTWDEPFIAGEMYTLELHLRPAAGYAFSENGVRAELNGMPLGKVFLPLEDGLVYVTARFAPVEAPKRTEITELRVTVSQPEADQQPDRSPAVPDGAPYEIVKAVWHLSSDADFSHAWDEPFLAGEGYTLELHVRPKAGYAFSENGVRAFVNEVPLDNSFLPLEDGLVYVTAPFAPVEAPAFTDVGPDDYYSAPVAWAVANSVTKGVGHNRFDPFGAVTRGQAVTFLWRAVGQPAPKAAVNPFVDVKETDYFYQAVLWANENAVTTGTDATHFSPSQSCTTAHIVTFLFRVFNPDEVAAGNDGWGAVSADWAQRLGLLGSGLELPVDNKTDCPRAAVVTYLYRALADQA